MVHRKSSASVLSASNGTYSVLRKAGVRVATLAMWLLFAWTVLLYANSWLLLPYDCADLGFVISYSKWDCSGPDIAPAPMSLVLRRCASGSTSAFSIPSLPSWPPRSLPGYVVATGRD